MINTSSIQLIEMTAAIRACLAEGHALGQSEWSRTFFKGKKEKSWEDGEDGEDEERKTGPLCRA